MVVKKKPKAVKKAKKPARIKRKIKVTKKVAKKAVKKPAKKKPKKDSLMKGIEIGLKSHLPPDDLVKDPPKLGKEPKGEADAKALAAEVYEKEDGMEDGEIIMSWYVKYNRVGKPGKNIVRLDAQTLAEAKFEAASLLGISEADIKEN